MRNLPVRLVSMALAALLLIGVAGNPAGASEVDLGSPATMGELLDSPEYRSWHANALRLYRAFFNREPDVEGALYWIDEYEDGISLDDMAWAFSQSAEFKNQYGPSLSNAEFLTIVYGNVLGRAPDQEGFDYWLGQMTGGLSQPAVVRWVVANQEFIDHYPYAGTAKPLADYLLDFEQAEALAGPYDFGRDPGPYPEPQLTGCDAARSWPKNDAIVGYGITNNAALYELAYEFSTVEAAQAFMNKARGVSAACNNGLYGGTAMTVTDFTAPNLGDEAIGHEFIDKLGQTNGFHWKEIYIRVGALVIAVDVSARIPVSVDGVVDYADTAFGKASHANRGG